MQKLKLLLLLVTVLLVGCPQTVPYVAPPELGAVSRNPNDWTILYSYNMPKHPSPLDGGIWQIPLPGPYANIHYVSVPFTAGATIPKQISITFKVISDKPVYNGRIDPACSDPATFHLWIERRGNNFTQNYYRWWAINGYVLGSADNQVHTITVPLTANQWIPVFGNTDAAQFAATLHNLNAVGLTFGGSGGWGHGMDLLHGAATFELINYTVN